MCRDQTTADKAEEGEAPPVSVESLGGQGATGKDQDDHGVFQATGVELHERFRVFRWWKMFTESLKKHLIKTLIFAGTRSAKYPLATIVGCIVLGIAIPVLGAVTNLKIETEGNILWTPDNALTLKHRDWVESSASGFPPRARLMDVVLHRDGGNVLSVDGVHRLFDVMDVIRQTSGYWEVCRLSRETVSGGDCPLDSATAFWNHNRTRFESNITTDEEVIRTLSSLNFANGDPVDRSVVFGNPTPFIPNDVVSATPKPPIDDVLMASAQSFLVHVNLPSEDEALPYEKDVTENLFALRDRWQTEGSTSWDIDLHTHRSFDDELQRGIEKDIPLMVAAFLMMGLFCAITLGRCHPVQSGSLVGAGAVATIILSIMTGYGLMFIIGVPFTSMTQIFPYVMVGVGLDDTFIITGAFGRTDKNKPIEERMQQVMLEVGVSITVSTLTTTVAFFLGCIATLPGIYWFCLYAAPTVLIDFVYQVTFFIAILAMDERRKKANRYDCCICFKSKRIDENSSDATGSPSANNGGSNETRFHRIARSYADNLLHPVTRVIVLIGFTILLALGALGASRQLQEFDLRDLLPDDSFVTSFYSATDNYGRAESRTLFICGAYFRDVDVSDTHVQDAMFEYVDDLVTIPYITFPPTFFWLRDFRRFSEDPSLANMTFYEQLDVFLSTAPYEDLYGDQVIRDSDGIVTASRTFINYDQVSYQATTRYGTGN